MSEQVETRLTPRERLTRGLAYSAVGPVDVTRGLLELGVGLGLQSARSTTALPWSRLVAAPASLVGLTPFATTFAR